MQNDKLIHSNHHGITCILFLCSDIYLFFFPIGVCSFLKYLEPLDSSCYIEETRNFGEQWQAKSNESISTPNDMSVLAWTYDEKLEGSDIFY